VREIHENAEFIKILNMTWRERQPLASLRRSLGLDTTPLKRLRADRTDAIDYVATDTLSCIDLSGLTISRTATVRTVPSFREI